MRYFYDLPVYRLSEDKYLRDQEHYVDSHVWKAPFPIEPALRDDLLPQLRGHLRESHGGMWQFNEIIGYIRLHFLGTQVRGEYIAVQRRRLVRTRRKQLQFQTWNLAPEREIPSISSSEQIYSIVLEYVDACRSKLKHRHVDAKGLETLGPYIDWKALYKFDDAV